MTSPDCPLSTPGMAAGAVHDLPLTRPGIWGIVRELAARRLVLLAAKGGTGAG